MKFVNKAICSLLLLFMTTVSYAADSDYYDNVEIPPPESAPDIYPLYQNFINQMSIGYTNLNFNFSNSGVASSNAVQLNLTKLFDMGIYLEATYQSLLNYSQQLYGRADSRELELLGDYPVFNFYSIKTGYAFRVIPGIFYLIPYLNTAYSDNWATYTVFKNADDQINMTDDYFLTAGPGIKIDYRVNKYVNTYYDLSINYNKSMAPKLNYAQDLSSLNFAAVIGSKFNIYDDFQIGVQAFGNALYYPNSPYLTPVKVLVTSYVYGGTLTFGLKY